MFAGRRLLHSTVNRGDAQRGADVSDGSSLLRRDEPQVVQAPHVTRFRPRIGADTLRGEHRVARRQLRAAQWVEPREGRGIVEVQRIAQLLTIVAELDNSVVEGQGVVCDDPVTTGFDHREDEPGFAPDTFNLFADRASYPRRGEELTAEQITRALKHRFHRSKPVA